MFVGRELSARLEHTEGMVAAAFVDARNAVSPVSATWRDFAGTTAIFDGVDSPMTQSIGLGLRGPAGETELAAIEAFFTERGADTKHKVSPFASIETMQALASRGYVPVELSNVLVRPIGRPIVRPTGPLPEIPAGLRVRRIDPAADGGLWIETSIAGWSADLAVAAFIRTIAEANIKNPTMTHYLVEADGAPIATASLGVHDGVALFAGASTRPEARGKGAQMAVLAQRLVDAKARGCTIALVVTAVGSTSQRNAERNGFRVAYTRTMWRRTRSAF